MTKNSLQAKLLILVLAVTLSSIIVISYISISTLQNALETKALQQWSPSEKSKICLGESIRQLQSRFKLAIELCN